MRKAILTGSLACLVAVVGSAAIADSFNWSTSKIARIESNRMSNAGIGNGGERKRRNGQWDNTAYGEDGIMDQDPGNSGAHNQACTGSANMGDLDQGSDTSC